MGIISSWTNVNSKVKGKKSVEFGFIVVYSNSLSSSVPILFVNQRSSSLTIDSSFDLK